MNATIENGRVVKVVGDRDSPLTQGFTCPKGRALPDQLSRPDRLLHTLHRDASGSLVPVASDAATAEVADRLGALVERYGPRSVALYVGTGSSGYAPTAATGTALWRAFGSSMVFNPGPIDQPGKGPAAALHGRWGGGCWTPMEAEVWTFIGTNPLVTMWGGTMMPGPARTLRDARKRGMRVVVIDPRRTELAAFSDIHLQARPGEDPTVLAGILRLLFEFGAVDHDFVTRHAVGVDALRRAIDPFTVDLVCHRAGIAPADLVAAAEIIGSDRRGGMSAGTGANMSPRSSLTEYLLLAVYTVLGYWRRAGDPVPNPGVLIPRLERKEQALPQGTGVFAGDSVLNGAILESAAGLQTAHIADDVLSDAPDRIRALVNAGGNPVVAWPGQARVRAAMERLDLLVTFDIGRSATTALSHVVFGTKFHLETANITFNDGIRNYGAAVESFPLPWAMYMPPLSAPPDGSDLIEEWQVFHGIARRLALPLSINGVNLGSIEGPDTDDVLTAMLRGAAVELSELKRHPRGAVFDVSTTVAPTDPNLPNDRRLRLGESRVLDDLAELAACDDGNGAPFRLVVRRTKEMKNSWGNDFSLMTQRFPRQNPAWLHPQDMVDLGLVTGDPVEIRSIHGPIQCLAEADETVLPGTVSVSHGWGGDGHPGANTNALTGDLDAGDRHSAIPVMSSIPVWIESAPVRR